MPVKPTSAGGAPVSARDRRPRQRRDRGCPAAPPPRRSTPGARRRSRTSGCVRRRSSITRPERGASTASGSCLARDHPPVDVDRCSGRARRSARCRPAISAALTVGRPASGCSGSGSTSCEPQQEARHRGDRVHPEVRRRAVRGRAERGRREPRAAALRRGRAGARSARPRSRRPGRAAHAPRAPSSRGSPRAPRRRPGGARGPAELDARPADRGGRGERGRDRALHVARAPPDQASVDDLAREGRRRHVSASPRERCRGGRSTRATGRSRRRSGRRATAGRPRPDRPRRWRRAPPGCPPATAAASSSVPPGFSEGRRSSARANGSTSSASTAPPPRRRRGNGTSVDAGHGYHRAHATPSRAAFGGVSYDGPHGVDRSPRGAAEAWTRSAPEPAPATGSPRSSPS